VFSFFRKKEKPAVEAEPIVESAPDFEEQVEAVAPPDEKPRNPLFDDEPLMTWEELEALEGKAARPSRRRQAVPGPAAEVVAEEDDEEEEADVAEAPPAPPRDPLEELLERCAADPEDADLAEEAARLAYARKQPERAAEPLLRTAMLLRASDPERAIDLFLRLAFSGQDTMESDQALFVLCQRLGRPADGELALRAMLKRDPRNVDALGLLADQLLGAKKYREAAEMLGRLVAVKPEDPVAHEKRGDALALLGDIRPAVEAWLAAAAGFEKRGKSDEAARLREQVALVDPENAAAAR
jgi:tetratricopeptide (TPR) repeat protein